MPNTILVVEDDDALRTLLVEVLAGEGHPVRSAVDGLDALEQILQRPPALRANASQRRSLMILARKASSQPDFRRLD